MITIKIGNPTGISGLTPTYVIMTENLGSTVASGNASEIGNGFYSVNFTGTQGVSYFIFVDAGSSITDPRIRYLSAKITEESSGGGATLAEIEASTVLAKKADVDGVPAAVRSNLAVELARLDVAVSTRMATFTYTAPDNSGIAAIKTKTDQLVFTSGNLHAVAKLVEDKTGYSLTPAERSAIAVAVEQAILNDGDGQAILNAIVGAIGNQNIDQIALVAAIRADIERTGGMLDGVPTLSEITGSSLAKTSDVTSAQTQIVTEVNANETKIDAVKAAVDGKPTLAQIEASSVLAKESSVSAIPTNPLLANDARLDNLDAPVSTAGGGLTTLQEQKLDQVKAKTDNLPASPASTTDVQVTVDGGFSPTDRATLEAIPTLTEIEASSKFTTIEGKLALLERMERATVRIDGTQLVMEDSIGEIQRWNMKDANGLPTSTVPYKKEKVS